MSEEYEPTHSHARSNGLVFTHEEVKPLASHNADTRPSGSRIRYNHTQPSGQAPAPPSRPHNPNPPATPAQFAHSDEIKGQAYLDNRAHEHPRPAHVRRDDRARPHQPED